MTEFTSELSRFKRHIFYNIANSKFVLVIKLKFATFLHIPILHADEICLHRSPAKGISHITTFQIFLWKCYNLLIHASTVSHIKI